MSYVGVNMYMVALTLLLALLLTAQTTSVAPREPYLVWHLTDVHVDPFYVVGSDATKCYCETAASCPRMHGCGDASSVNASAQALGNSEGDCATPKALYESAAEFMGRTTPSLSGGVYFTGDFAEAGASYSCLGNNDATDAQQQILDIMAYDWATLKGHLPAGSRLYGSLGNHDSVPGDIFYGRDKQSWQYKNLTSLWADDLAHEAPALATLKEGGYYATRATTGLTVISLNVNYWCTFAPAESLGSAEAQFEWFARALAEAEARGDAVHILGHEPPGDDGAPRGGTWRPGFWGRYTALCDKFQGTIKAQLYGHIHTDQWTLTRACRNISVAEAGYKETTGIKWCSGGGNYAPNPVDTFGAGADGHCPLVPPDWSTAQAVAACEKVCTNVSECLGFTFYFNQTDSHDKRECCFRTGSVASKPPCPSCTARCYEKPPSNICDGSASGVLLPGPSLTEGFPATNPAIRLLKFDPKTFELLDATTFTADLHEANRVGKLDWKVEYEFKTRFQMVDMSPSSFELLATRLLGEGDGVKGVTDSSLWDTYKGQGDGSLYCKGFNSTTSPFPPTYPCKPCTGQCRHDFVSYLNATNLQA